MIVGRGAPPLLSAVASSPFNAQLHSRPLTVQLTTPRCSSVTMGASPVATVAGIAAALVLLRIATKWDSRLSALLNLIFLAIPAPKMASVTDDDDPEMAPHIEKLRQSHAKGMVSLPTVDVGSTEDLVLPRSSDSGGVPVRMYYPPSTTTTTSESPLPWLLYYHGGGWCLGSVDTHDAFCRRLCAGANVAVASVEYRRSPEHKYPAPDEDCFDALVALRSGKVPTLRQLDPQRAAVGGDSSGGTLAANVAIRAARCGIPLRLQLLLCPALDAAANTPSYDTNANAPGLSAETMRWLWERYLPSGDAAARLAASPLQAVDLSGVAPAYIVAAELDVLRDEAEIYASRIRGTGGQATFVAYDGGVHTFLVYSGTPLALGDVALDEAARFLSFSLLG